MQRTRSGTAIAILGALALSVPLAIGLRRAVTRRARPDSEAVAPAYTRLSFYIVAHEDDWELFRGEAAYRDLQSSTTRVVFIYVTSGDSGRTDGFWEAREQGAIAAVRSALGRVPLTIEVPVFRSHPIVRYEAGNSASYFLRLPDGNIDTAKGYEEYGNQSLAQLRAGVKPITAVDKSTTYATWDDLWLTLQAVMNLERTRHGVAAAVVSAPDYSDSCDPGNHTDHRTTGFALRMFAAPDYDRIWVVGYDIKNRPENLPAPDVANKLALFRAYSDAVQDLTTRNGEPVRPDRENWRLYGSRSYSRFTRQGDPDLDTPPCRATPPAGP